VLARSHGKALIMGNVDRAGAVRLTELVQAAFPFSPLSKEQRAARKIVVVPPTSAATGAGAEGAGAIGYRISRPEPNANDDNSAASFYFQLPSRDPASYMSLELLSDVLEQPFYNSLRTQQQLGYIVYSGIKIREGVRSLTFVAQSSIVDGAELTARIEVRYT
jgi:insulysin